VSKSKILQRKNNYFKQIILFLIIVMGFIYVEKAHAQSNFMPQPPYYATFFYPWYENPNAEGRWSQWTDLGHRPPQNWFSEYLPDPNPNAFDPANELYGSSKDSIIYWQLSKMAEARQEVAISSWWGQTHKTNGAFNKIIKDIMNRSDNPYPNLRWAIYYEKEGFGNPSLTELLSDVNYIKAQYTNEKSYLKINGKPVIFVYNAAHGGSNPNEDLSRWKQVRAQTGFYVVMKTDPINAGANPSDMDGWHEYAPAVRTNTKGNYWYMVSPGFWLNGSAERLPRDAAAFEAGVRSMVGANVTWKLTETWNEWGEGSGVEPAEQVNQTTSGTATLKTNGYPFKNLYVDILKRNLPPLEQGTGSGGNNNPTATPQPTNSAGKTGDVNSDGKVDIVDIGVIIDNYGRNPIPNQKADVNRDGRVDIIDIGLCIDNYGR
jgi:hypothetical protein